MSDAHAVIARCTRGGVTSWQNVARQLGMSVDKARRLYDPVSSARRDPQQLAEPPMTDAQAYKSPHPKGDGLKVMILTLLERHRRLTAEDLAARTHSTPPSIRRRMGDLLAQGLVQGEQVSATAVTRSWWLTAAGRTMAKTYHSRPGDIGPGAKSAIGRAA